MTNPMHHSIPILWKCMDCNAGSGWDAAGREAPKKSGQAKQGQRLMAAGCLRRQNGNVSRLVTCSGKKGTQWLL